MAQPCFCYVHILSLSSPGKLIKHMIGCGGYAIGCKKPPRKILQRIVHLGATGAGRGYRTTLRND